MYKFVLALQGMLLILKLCSTVEMGTQKPEY